MIHEVSPQTPATLATIVAREYARNNSDRALCNRDPDMSERFKINFDTYNRAVENGFEGSFMKYLYDRFLKNISI